MPQTIDLGDVYLGEDREFLAELANSTRQDVEITEASAGCSCTNVKLSSQVIGRGLTTELRGVLKGKGKPGEFRHHVTIRTSDRARPLIVAIIGTAKSRIRVEPESIVLRPDFKSGRGDNQVVTVTNESDTELVLNDLSLPRGIDMDLGEQRVAPGSSLQIKVRVGCERVVSEEIIVRIPCDHLSERYVRVPLQIEPRHQVVIEPRKFLLGVATKNELLSRERPTVLLSGPLLADYDLVVSSLPAYISLERAEHVDSMSRRLHFRVRNRWTGFDLNGEVTVSLRARASGEIAGDASVSIPFRGFLVDARQ
ncbi:MAG: DUF1573 domain-containing protein [Planctomycetes bacterium]|nr:DUF1573 domain-containing protein [Planctomycetota bacterium]